MRRRWSPPLGLGLGLQAAGVGPIATTTAAGFVLDGLPSGPVALSLYVPEHGPLQGPTVTVVAGESVEANLVVNLLGDHADAIVARFRMQPSVSFPGPSAAHVWLVRANGERRPARRDKGGFVFHDVGPGHHRIEVNDPRLAAWSQDGLSAGASVHAHLWGSATVELRVSLPSGEPVAAFSVDARSEGVHYSSSRFLAATEAAPLPGGVLNLVPGDYVFTLESAGVSAAALVRGLIAGENRIVPVTLDAARLVRGRVVHSNGDPAAGQLVRLVTPALVADSPESPVLDGDTMMVGDTSSARHQVSRTVTDSDGRFTLAPSAGSEHIVVVGRNFEPQIESAGLDTSAGAQNGELELVLERGARLIVHVEPPAGLSTAGWNIVFVRSGLVARCRCDAQGPRGQQWPVRARTDRRGARPARARHRARADDARCRAPARDGARRAHPGRRRDTHGELSVPWRNTGGGDVRRVERRRGSR